MVRGGTRSAAPAANRKRPNDLAASPASSTTLVVASHPGSSPRKADKDKATEQRIPEEPAKRRKTAAAHIPALQLENVEEGELYVMGSGETGQLGLGPDVFEKERPARLNELKEKGIVGIEAGGMSSFAFSDVDENGEQKVFSWGCNDNGALGRDTTEDSDKETMCNETVQGLENAGKIVRIVAGDSVTFALTSEGHLYGTGTFRDAAGVFGFLPDVKEQKKFTRLDFASLKDRAIVSVSVGANHVIAVDSEGLVYTWGVAEQGQLGRRVLENSRRVQESSLMPRRINFRSKRKLVKFSSVWGGAYHTLLVTDDGREVYAMGLNNHGQLGLGHTENMVVPELIPLEIPDGVKIKQCAGGEHHSMILLDNGDLYGFGRNDSHQLGLATTPAEEGDDAESGNHIPVPTKIPEIPPIKQVSCGSHFTLAVTEELDLWGWGYGERGQLGSEDSQDVEEPEQIEIRGRKCLKVAAGGQHTILLIRKKDE